MRFDLTDDQAAFRTSLRRTLEAIPALPDRMVAGTAEAELERHGGTARKLAELGVFGILVPEEAGGIGLGFVEAAIAATEFGRAALPFPGTEAMLGTAAAAIARPQDAAPLLDGAEGATCALDGALRRRGNRLVGEVVAPYAGDCRWLAAAIDAGTVAVIDLTGAGVEVRPQPSLDLTQIFARVAVDLPLEEVEQAPFQLEAALRLMGCAEMAGSARRCLDLAVDYLKTRTQFGQVIGKNQALRHMAASDALACDTMEISVEYAAWAMDAARGNAPAAAVAEAAQALSAARAGIADQARTVAEHSVQLHGGIGFTWEYGLHLHFRRIARLASHFGGVVAEQERLAQAALADCGLGAPPGRPAQAVPHLAEMGAN
jgi:alkylation response protein AidB-like acyl-CoA dehydrogenase